MRCTWPQRSSASGCSRWAWRSVSSTCALQGSRTRCQVACAAMRGHVVRVWKGSGTSDGVTAYCERHFRPVVLPQLQALNGFLGATLLVRARETGDTEVVVATRW